MANEDLKVRFTDKSYATRQDVARALGTNLIDPIWASILEYRKGFNQNPNLVDFTKTPYMICCSKFILERIADVNQKNYHFKEIFENTPNDSLDFERVMNSLMGDILKSLAKANNKQLDDVSLRNILKNQNIDPQFAYLQRYVDAFDIFERKNFEINEDLLAEFYEKITGNPELSEFYRTSDLAQQSNILIGREYSGAPLNLIESQMDQLLRFIERRDLPLFVRVSTVCYLFNYIKPFKKYNFEMSMLLCKSMIVNELGEYGAYLPIEHLLVDQQLQIGTLSKEVQRTHDLTYVISVHLDILSKAIDAASNVFVHQSIQQVREEFEQDIQLVKKENEVSNETPKVNPQPVIQPKPVLQEEQPKVHSDSFNVVNETSLSEKELQKLTQELLETDPTLKKGQAHFYIRHREQGHFYTIEQYRKCEGCVYETARTSMDHLALRGYYRREKVNNKKFVYTPIFKE